MRTIGYTKKITSANTIYVDISQDDRDYLSKHIKFMGQILDHIDGLASEYPRIVQELDRSRTSLPRRGKRPYGANSYRTFVRGLIENFADTQRDYSLKTLVGLESLFAFFAANFHTIEEVRFWDKNTRTPHITNTAFRFFPEQQ